MQTDEIIREILKSISFRNTDIESDSHYLLNTNRRGRPIQIRVSNHGTYLRTWVDLANGKDSNIRLVDPSTSINISIVFVDKDKNLTKDCIVPNCEDCSEEICKPSIVKGVTAKNRQYSVLQYVYQSEKINRKYLKSIINAINRASIGGRYIDPLRSLQLKRAKVKPLKSRDNITENNNTKIQSNMKKRIRLTEGDLRKIVRQCVNEAADSTNRQEVSQTFKRLCNLQRSINTSKLEKALEMLDTYTAHYCDNDENRRFADDLYYLVNEGNDILIKLETFSYRLDDICDEFQYAYSL